MYKLSYVAKIHKKIYYFELFWSIAFFSIISFKTHILLSLLFPYCCRGELAFPFSWNTTQAAVVSSYLFGLHRYMWLGIKLSLFEMHLTKNNKVITMKANRHIWELLHQPFSRNWLQSANVKLLWHEWEEFDAFSIEYKRCIFNIYVFLILKLFASFKNSQSEKPICYIVLLGRFSSGERSVDYSCSSIFGFHMRVQCVRFRLWRLKPSVQETKWL